VLTVLLREKSQKLVPLFVAAMSVRCLHYRVPRHCWDTLTFFTRALMSHAWTEQLCEAAVARDPILQAGRPYPTIDGVSAAVFDNFTITANYGSYATADSSGTRMDMTNWASALLPATAAPAGFSLRTMLSGGSGGVVGVAGGAAGGAPGSIFRSDRRLPAFLELFAPAEPEILANQRERWRQFLSAASAKTLFDKPAFQSPYPPTRFQWHDPIFDHMQSSYKDVNFELDVIRKSPFHRHADLIFLGGDGLSYMRLIHRLAQDPQKFVMKTPIIIPQLGEHPHGTYHVMHGDWRLWWPLLEQFAHVANNKQVIADPPISAFNKHEHFLCICMRACAEYVVEIAEQGGSDYRQVDQFFADANPNLSFLYVCNFLYLAAFKFQQMRNAVRTNDSKVLDIIWRENLATCRSDLGNKTNYAQMSIVRVYWGWALREPLQKIYHNLRTLRFLRTHVGYDWPIEQLNLWIREGVTSNITEEQLRKFIRRLNFTHVVNRGLDEVVRTNRSSVHDTATMKDVDTTVALIKDFLRDKIGDTYVKATSATDENKMGLDLSSWGGDRDARQRRQGAPWEHQQRGMSDFREYVRGEIVKLAPWHLWAP
jgi:hypothetical protein